MSINGTTKVMGVIADPVEHTMSPLIQNAAIEAMGVNVVYVPFRVTPDNLAEAISGMRAFGIRGLNVTVPHKTAVMQYLDRITDEAKSIGAVNTIINDNGVLVGDNTDVYGFMMCLSIEGELETLPERICVLGAGGATRGVVYGCAAKKEVREIFIINRTVEKAERIARDFAPLFGATIKAMPADEDSLREIIPSAGLVINTTSVGMNPDNGRSPVSDPDLFHEGQAVCDIIYNPLRTKMINDAALKGAKVIPGLAMLAYQGARSLSLWTGIEAPAETMLEVLRNKFE